MVAALEKTALQDTQLDTQGVDLPVQETQVGSLDDQSENSAPDME